MYRHITRLAAVAVLLTASGAQADEILNIGDPAPKLAVSGWVKGEKVDSFEPGKTYVVEFWATWCGPCRASIPHVSELAHKYKEKGVRFIGVDVWENNLEKVKPFVEEMGAKMDYNVALDSVPEGASPGDGAMAKTWMLAAGENGIPAAFIVHDGKIAWIGHPMSMDDPLAKVVAGNWDAKAIAATRLAEKRKEKKMVAVQMKIITPYRSRDYRATLSAIDEVIAADPEMANEPMIGSIRLHSLNATGATDEAIKLGEKLLKSFHDDPMALNNAFYGVIDLGLTRAPDRRIAELALQAARRADELTKGAQYSFLDTLAIAQYRTGDAAGAVATEEKAIKLLDNAVSPEVRQSSAFQNYRKRFESNLETFRKAAEKGGKA